MRTENALMRTANARLQTENARLQSDSDGMMGRALAKLKAENEEAWREVESEREVSAELRRANALLVAEAEHSAALAARDAAVVRLERAEASHKRARGFQ